MARALLYAERAVALSDGSAEALRDRAYVLTLVGLLAAGGRDLDAAHDIDGHEGAAAWLGPLRASCDGDMPLLHSLAGEDGNALAALLYWRMQQHRSEKIAERAAMGRVLQHEPDCLRMMFQVATIKSLGTKAAAVTTFEWLPQAMHRQIKKVEDLPAEVIEEVGTSPPEDGVEYTEIVTMLHAQGSGGVDTKEPSLGVLGQLLNEAGFLAAWQVLDYNEDWLSMSIDQRAVEVSFWAESHPYANALRVRARRGASWNRGGAEFLAGMNRAEIELAHSGLHREFYNADRARTIDHDRVLAEHLDMIVPEIIVAIGNAHTHRTKLSRLQRLKAIAPQLPATLEWRISLERAEMHAEFDTIEEEYHDDVSLQRQLSEIHSEMGNVEAAVRCARRWIELEPGYESYRYLASVEETQGTLEGWLQALELSLQHPVPGLEHSQTRIKISQHFLDAEQPERALLYAEAAAHSFAAWALTHAAHVHTTPKNWDEAEAYLSSAARRYPVETLTWYYWCLTHGQGDRQAAEAAARRYLQRRSTASVNDAMNLSVIDFVNEEYQASYDRVLPWARTTREPFYQWWTFILADILDEDAVRHEMLDLIIEISDSGDELVVGGTAPLAAFIKAWLLAGGQEPLDIALLDRQIAQLPGDCPTNMWFFLSQFLLTHGEDAAGMDYQQRAALSPFTNLWSQQIASFLCHEGDLDVGPHRQHQYVPLQTPLNESEARLLQLPAPCVAVRFRRSSPEVIVTSQDGVSVLWNPETGVHQEWIAGRGWLSDGSPDDGRAAILADGLTRFEV